MNTNVVTELTAVLRAAIVKTLGPEFAETDPVLRRSTHADFQANCALALQKLTKENPRALATKIVANLDAPSVLERVEIAGPGFLNIHLRADFWASALAAQLADERAGVALSPAPEVVVIDYSSPNAAKEMHVGHLRSTVIGDALHRVLAFRGHRVVPQNHLGDWGTPFGMLIEHLLDSDADGTTDTAALNSFYKQARAKFDSSPEFAERARRRVVLLQAGDAETLASWRRLIDESKLYMRGIYARLGVLLKDEDICGESFFNPALAPLAQELEERGLASINEGALCLYPPGFVNREGNPMALMLRKQDGGFGYGATDVAALRYRVEKLGGTRLLYVVGSPQSQHLAMIFKAGELAGFMGGARAEHVQFGSVLGADGKMFKTREGETVRLSALLAEGEERAKATVLAKATERDEPPPADVDSAAHSIAIAAIKYADLSSDRIKDYVFDWDRMLADKGNTGPYLQYAYARTQSILRKADAPFESAPILLNEPAERALALTLLAFSDAVNDVESSLEPHRLCTYLYELASVTSTFYTACPVLKAEPELRASRLALCKLSGQVLQRGLELLGITAIARM